MSPSNWFRVSRNANDCSSGRPGKGMGRPKISETHPWKLTLAGVPIRPAGHLSSFPAAWFRFELTVSSVQFLRCGHGMSCGVSRKECVSVLVRMFWLAGCFSLIHTWSHNANFIGGFLTLLVYWIHSEKRWRLLTFFLKRENKKSCQFWFLHSRVFWPKIGGEP